LGAGGGEKWTGVCVCVCVCVWCVYLCVCVREVAIARRGKERVIWVGDMAQVVECLPSNLQALSSTTSTRNKIKKSHLSFIYPTSTYLSCVRYYSISSNTGVSQNLWSSSDKYHGKKSSRVQDIGEFWGQF
jgi:hypothetical protein